MAEGLRGRQAATVLIGAAGVALFWLLTRGLDGPRALRPFVTVCAAYGVAAGGAGLWAGNFERPNFVEEAMTGALIIGAVAGVVAFLILLLLPRGR